MPWGKILLSAGSLVLTIFILVSSLYLINEHFGANVAPYSGTELGKQLWEVDPDVGYKNKGATDFLDFGNVRIHTNSTGFRSEQEIPPNKAPGSLRIIGIGDSLMWGLHVQSEDTVMGFLETLGKEKGRNLETYNAAVIGYDSYQERVFFKKYVVDKKPNVVFLIFCNNDWAPTEDPYRNLVGITKRYLNALLRKPGSFSPKELETMKFGLDDIRRIVNIRWSPDDFKRGFFKAMIEMPLFQIAHMAKANRIRFVVVFVPYVPQSKMEDETVDTLKRSLRSRGIEFLDTGPYLVEEGVSYEIKSPPPWLAALKRTADLPFLYQLNPAVVTGRFYQLVYWRWINGHRNFQDPWGHPTRKGNRIIAERLYSYLFQTSLKTPGK